MAVLDKYPCKRFSTLARIGGAGYRQLARLDHYRNSHFERVLAMYMIRRYTLEWKKWTSSESILEGDHY